MQLRVCGVQMVVSRELDVNLPKILSSIGVAAEDSADIVLFPEMSLSGYHGDYRFDAVKRALRKVSAAAKKSKIAVVVGTGWREDGVAYIQNCAYDADGTLLGTHEKMVPTGIGGKSGDRAFCIPGKQLRTFVWRGITCGSLICNDLWVTPGCGPHPDPRLAYQLGQKGAKIIFHAINSGCGERHLPYHESNVALRAEESKLYIVTANAASMDKPINCSSGVMGPNGEWVTKLDRQGEGRYIAPISVPE